MSGLTPDSLQEGSRNIIHHYEKTFGKRPLAKEDEEILRLLGTLLEEKVRDGWRYAGSIYPVYSYLFLYDNQELLAKRDELIAEFGGPEKFAFYHLVRTNEVIIFLKD